MPDIFQTSVSGLLAMQRALATTNHNISNVNTPGYSRQEALFDTRPPEATGGGFIGTGVESTTIRRLFSQTRQDSVRNNSAEFNRLDTFAELSGRIDNLLADPDAGLSPALQGFFDAVQTLATDPTSNTARQVLLTEGENLQSRFEFLDARFEELERDVNARLDVQVAEVNELASAIAELNQQIVVAEGAVGQPPNDLLDKRDQLLVDLSERISTKLVVQDNGSINVFVGNGQALVAGNSANQLDTVADPFDASRQQVAYVTAAGGTVDITRSLSGGSLGGLLEFRRDVLDSVRNDVGRLATSIGVTFNEQHRLGYQFDGGAGAFGGDFFDVGQPDVRPQSGITATGIPTVTLDEANIEQLSGSDYRLVFDGGGGQWVLTRLSDLTQTNIAVGGTATLDGITIDTSTIAGQVDGDAFAIRPTRLAARGLEVALDRPSQVAAASALATGETLDGTGQSANTGSGSIGPATITTQTGLPLAGDITLTFDAGANQFVVAGGPGGTIAYNPSTDSAGLTVNFPAFGNMTFELSGVPDDGDQFTITNNDDGVGDNGNALALGGLEDSAILDGGQTTFSEFNGQIVGDVGSKTLRANVNRDAQDALLNEAVANREALSGVNLEEEAANLLRFQQAFQANAQAISVANSLFQSLIQAVG